MTNSLKKLYEDRSDYETEMEGMVAKAKSERRDFNPSETRRADEVMATLENLDIQIKELEAQENRMKKNLKSNMNTQRYDDGTDLRSEPGRVFLDKARSISLIDSRTSLKLKDSKEDQLSLGQLLVARLRGPINDVEKNALDTTLDASGGISTVVSRDFWDRTRSASTVVRAGARTLDFTDGAHGGVVIPQITGSIQPEWKEENALATLSDPTFTPRTLEWKTLFAACRVSNELLQDAGDLLANMIESDLSKGFSSELDRVALLGSGTGEEPRGVANTSGINAISMGTNGAALTNFNPLVGAVRSLLEADVPLDRISAFIMAPRSWAELANLKSATDLQQLNIPSQIATIPQLVTSKISTSQTQGSANTASTIFAADWSQLVIGVRLSMKIKFHESTFAQSYSTLITAASRVDIALVHPASFTKIVGVIPAS